MNVCVTMLIVSIMASLILFVYILRNNFKNQLNRIFAINISLLLVVSVSALFQLLFADKLNIEYIRFEYISHIGICFLPISVFFTGLFFHNRTLSFKRVYLLLLIVPILSLFVLWTNDNHHLFYTNYSVFLEETIYGPYAIIHAIYSYTLLLIGMFFILKSTLKSSGTLSKQAILILVGISIPITTNILGSFKIIPMSIYIMPITFSATILMLAVSIFQFQFLGIAPIALQLVVNRISDSYVVLGINNTILDFNEPFIKTFRLTKKKIKNLNFKDLLEKTGISDADVNYIIDSIKNVKSKNKMSRFEQEFKKISKTFQIEITPIISNGNSLGIIFLLKDISQHKKDISTIQNNQAMLMERERLASLGQLIGGIAHNLKTPIMSISGAVEGINDLVNEFDASIGNPIVTNNDFHDIAKEMQELLTKIKSYTEYMSDILTAVKGQAVNLSEQDQMEFTIEELFKRVDILMKHELNQALIYLNISLETNQYNIINGDVNSLVQVINNMISNSIQAYDGKHNQHIDLIAWKNDDNNIVISVKDYGPGLSPSVRRKLFKEMITTKGKNGTGLGLYMSYSTIKAHFNGDITVETEKGKGTTFNIILPNKENT